MFVYVLCDSKLGPFCARKSSRTCKDNSNIFQIFDMKVKGKKN